MKKMKMIALMLTLAMFAFSCGGSDSKKDSSPTDNGGSSSGLSSSSGTLTTHAGTNAAVTESNVQEVSAEVTGKSFEVFGRAMQTASYGAAKPYAGQVINLDGKVSGNKSGYAQVKGKYTINMTGTTVSNYTYDFTATYYDFADDETMYIGGGLKYTGTTENVTDYNNMKSTVRIKGGLKFNGAWEGTQDFTTVYTINGQTVTWASDITTKSGGKTFNTNVKYPE